MVFVRGERPRSPLSGYLTSRLWYEEAPTADTLSELLSNFPGPNYPSRFLASARILM
ncbi:hypothetical protein WA026_005648, partial [Henosepilachna vigintioctopunctata]